MEDSVSFSFHHIFFQEQEVFLILSDCTCRGTGPSPRSNHVAALYDDKTLFIFGGASKSKTLNDLYSLDFETVCETSLNLSLFFVFGFCE